MEFNDGYGLYILCSVEDNEDNLSYILHKYKIINGIYTYVDSTVVQ